VSAGEPQSTGNPLNPFVSFSGGHFLQTAITRYTTTLAAAQSHSATPLNGDIEDPGKQPLNILTLVSELYNFQVVGCLLIYDLVKGFIQDLGTLGFKGEFAVEGVLRVLRCESSW
jgi:nucleolar MIF4G domain-containing protein 1